MVKFRSLLSLLTALVSECLGTIQNFQMQSSHLCPGQVLSSAYRYLSLASPSALHCVIQCRSNSVCLSVVYDVTSRSCHLGNQSAGDACANMVARLGKQKYYQLIAPCQNGGVLNQFRTCDCVNSYVGPSCSRYMRDCDEGFSTGFFSTSGVYTIQPNDATQPFSIVCWMIQKNVRNYVFVRQRNGILTGNRTWAEYREGFGSLTTKGEYWLGLEKLYQLAQSNTYMLRVRYTYDNGTAFYFTYNNFVLADEARGYSISAFTSYKGAGECITDAVGLPFSTYDRGNDNSSSGNCAARMGGGWWYSGAACSRCNLLGPNMVLDGFNDTLVSGVVYYLVL